MPEPPAAGWPNPAIARMLLQLRCLPGQHHHLACQAHLTLARSRLGQPMSLRSISGSG